MPAAPAARRTSCARRARRRDRVRRRARRSSWPRSSSGCARSGWATRASTCWCPPPGSRTCGRWARRAARALHRQSRAARGRAGSASARADRRRDAATTTSSRGWRRNEWKGAVEPRLVLRSLLPVPTRLRARTPAPRRRGREPGGEAVRAERGARPWPAGRQSPATARRARSRRESSTGAGGACSACWATLVSTGETVAVVCADVSRRRELVLRSSPRAAWAVGGRCAQSVRSDRGPACAERVDASRPERDVAAGRPRDACAASGAARALHAPRRARPALSGTARGAARIAAGRRERPGFLHLAWGAAEVDFAARILEQELGAARCRCGHLPGAAESARRAAEGRIWRPRSPGAGAHRTHAAGGRTVPARAPEPSSAS